MDWWFSVILIGVGLAALLYACVSFFSKRFYGNWTSDLAGAERGTNDHSFGKNYEYHRYLSPLRAICTGLLLLSVGLISTDNSVLEWIGLLIPFVVLPVGAILSIIFGFIVLLSPRANERFWNRVWYVQGKETNRRLVAGYLIGLGMLLGLLLYILLYVTAVIPKIQI